MKKVFTKEIYLNSSDKRLKVKSENATVKWKFCKKKKI